MSCSIMIALFGTIWCPKTLHRRDKRPRLSNIRFQYNVADLPLITCARRSAFIQFDGVVSHRSMRFLANVFVYLLRHYYSVITVKVFVFVRDNERRQKLLLLHSSSKYIVLFASVRRRGATAQRRVNLEIPLRSIRR